MKWVCNDKVWYSGDVIEQITANLEQVALACHCDNCDGCGYYEGCGDSECGTYQAHKCLELINNEEQG